MRASVNGTKTDRFLDPPKVEKRSAQRAASGEQSGC